jgi:hypothetical protein
MFFKMPALAGGNVFALCMEKWVQVFGVVK